MKQKQDLEIEQLHRKLNILMDIEDDGDEQVLNKLNVSLNNLRALRKRNFKLWKK